MYRHLPYLAIPQNKHTRAGTQKFENAQVYKSTIVFSCVSVREGKGECVECECGRVGSRNNGPEQQTEMDPGEPSHYNNHYNTQHFWRFLCQFGRFVCGFWKRKTHFRCKLFFFLLTACARLRVHSHVSSFLKYTYGCFASAWNQPQLVRALRPSDVYFNN